MGAVQSPPNNLTEGPVSLYALDREIRLLTRWLRVGHRIKQCCLHCVAFPALFPALLVRFRCQCQRAAKLRLKGNTFKVIFEDRGEWSFVTMTGSISIGNLSRRKVASSWGRLAPSNLSEAGYGITIRDCAYMAGTVPTFIWLGAVRCLLEISVFLRLIWIVINTWIHHANLSQLFTVSNKFIIWHWNTWD